MRKEFIEPKLKIEDRDNTQEYRPIPVIQFLQSVKDQGDRVEIYVPNLCGGERRITIYKELKKED